MSGRVRPPAQRTAARLRYPRWYWKEIRARISISLKFNFSTRKPPIRNSLTPPRSFMKKQLLAKIVTGALLLAQTVLAAGADTENGFKSIFNGKDLSGWDGNPKLWSVKDGAILGRTAAEDPIKG